MENRIYTAISNDDANTVSSLISSGSFIETYISKAPPNSPVIMKQNPPLSCIAAYFGSFKCLQYFLDNGYDLFTPDKISSKKWFYKISAPIFIMEF